MRRSLLPLLLLLAAAPAPALEAAAGKVDITPDLARERVYLAGYGAKGRRPAGVHDPLYARLLLLREGGRVVALASFDLLGLYLKDSRRLEELWRRGDPAKSLFVHATHQHAGPDTLGLWGPLPGVSGVNREWKERVLRSVAEELLRLETKLVPVTARGAAGTLDPRGLCRDSRDPQVIDPRLAVLRLEDRRGRAVATAVNWSCHPEVLDRRNPLISADFPGPLCRRIEERTGGACLFLNGLIGGLMTPDQDKDDFGEVERIGAAVADAALALKPGPPAAGLRHAARAVRVPVENSRYLLFLTALTDGHDLLDASGAPHPRSAAALSLRHLLLGLREEERPWVETRVTTLDIGPARLVGLPGEVFPELVLGGYDGRYSFGRPVVSTANAAPPDLAAAPKGPFLRSRVRAPVPMLVGLADDELGYLVPEYDFKIRPGKLMLPRLPGHYEETNSIGRRAAGLVLEAAEELLKEPRP